MMTLQDDSFSWITEVRSKADKASRDLIQFCCQITDPPLEGQSLCQEFQTNSIMSGDIPGSAPDNK